jgi:hypothetical protein
MAQKLWDKKITLITVVGSNPAPATIIEKSQSNRTGFFLFKKLKVKKLTK